MSHWNYRIVHYEDEGEALGIHEVYYDDQGNIESWSDKPSVVGNDLEDLQSEFTNLQKAFKLGVLESSTLPGEQVEVVKEPNALEKEAAATTNRAEVRREALEEACKTICDSCYAMAKNTHVTLEYNGVYQKFEHTYRYKIGTFEEFSGHEDCKATPIRKLMIAADKGQPTQAAPVVEGKEGER